MNLVAGIDTSTQSCKVLVVDADTGAIVRQGRAKHPDGTEVHPQHWLAAAHTAIAEAGGLDDVVAFSVGGQQHGMVCLAEKGEVVRPALLWNDTRSAPQAAQLIAERGADWWAQEVGVVPVAAITVSKLRWLAEHEPEHARRTRAVCLPHDWLTWQLLGAPVNDEGPILKTDRSDASGTGYWSVPHEAYVPEIASEALGHEFLLPRVRPPQEPAGEAPSGALVGPGAGDNAAAALGLGARSGDVIISIGTSGVASAVSEVPASDSSGLVAGFADASGRYLPLACTLNAAQVIDAMRNTLNVDHHEFSDLALSAKPGAGGAAFVPYLVGERTPNLPHASGSLHGLTLANLNPANLARASVEGMLCGLADGMDALIAQGARVDRILLIGGAATSPVVQRLAPGIFGRPVEVPSPGEYVAYGAARQAAWVWSGSDAPPEWKQHGVVRHEADPTPQIRERYREAVAALWG